MMSKSEMWLARLMFSLVLLVGLMCMAGCTQIEQQAGGKMLGASVSVAGITLSLSGTIPTAPPAAP